jgi:hypothetical protein
MYLYSIRYGIDAVGWHNACNVRKDDITDFETMMPVSKSVMNAAFA